MTRSIEPINTRLVDVLGRRLDDLTFIGRGWFSEAYSFSLDDETYILRLSKHPEDFQKDQYAYVNFSSPKLPIPRIVRLGRWSGDLYFAITERCPGVTMDRLDGGAAQMVSATLFDTMAAVHAVDVSGLDGWGTMDEHGRGISDSWQAYLRSFHNDKFVYRLPALFEESFLERPVFETLLAEMEKLLPYCPEDKWLVHGDFGFDNVTVADGRVSGVFDWAEAMLGDFLFDLAYLDFYSAAVPYGQLWEKYTQAQGLDVPNFEERLCCYMLRQGLGDLLTYATTRNRHSYVRARERTWSVLAPGRRRPTDWTQ